MGTHAYTIGQQYFDEQGWADVYLCAEGDHGGPFPIRKIYAIVVTHNQSFSEPVARARLSVIEFVRDAVNECVPSPEERMDRIRAKFAQEKPKGPSPVIHPSQ